MGRIVFCPLDNLTVTTSSDQDIWELASPSSARIALHGFELTSAATTAAALVLKLKRGTASGSGGATPTLTDANSANADGGTVVGVVETLNTTPGTDGVTLQTFTWEQIGPLTQIYTPEMRPILAVSDWMKLNLTTALGGSTVWNGWLCWEEGV